MADPVSYLRTDLTDGLRCLTVRSVTNFLPSYRSYRVPEIVMATNRVQSKTAPKGEGVMQSLCCTAFTAVASRKFKTRKFPTGGCNAA